MFKRVIQALTVWGLTVGMIFSAPQESKKEVVVHEPVVVKTQEYISGPAKHIEVKTMTKSTSIGISNEDIDLLALVTMAEAEGESELGKRLVISTVLNRVDSEHFPDTVEEVIYQTNAFSSMWNGRVDKCYVSDDIRQLVKEEILNRTDNDVMYFCTGDYSNYGSPMFSEGNHYFSSYN